MTRDMFGYIRGGLIGDLAGGIEEDPEHVSTLVYIVDRVLYIGHAGNEDPGL